MDADVYARLKQQAALLPLLPIRQRQLWTDAPLSTLVFTGATDAIAARCLDAHQRLPARAQTMGFRPARCDRDPQQGWLGTED